MKLLNHRQLGYNTTTNPDILMSYIETLEEEYKELLENYEELKFRMDSLEK